MHSGDVGVEVGFIDSGEVALRALERPLPARVAMKVSAAIGGEATSVAVMASGKSAVGVAAMVVKAAFVLERLSAIGAGKGLFI